MAKKPKADVGVSAEMTKDKQRFPFTEAAVKAIARPARGVVTYYDVETPGLQLDITAAGSKSFVYYMRDWLVGPVCLGKYPRVSLDQAQRLARKITEELDTPSWSPGGIDALMRPMATGPNDAEEVREETLDPDGMYPAQRICGPAKKLRKRMAHDAKQIDNFDAIIAELVADLQEAERSLAPSILTSAGSWSHGSPVEFEIGRAFLHLSCLIAYARDDRTQEIVAYAIQAARACERLRARTNHEPGIRKQREGNRKKGKTRERHLTENERRSRDMLEEKLRAASEAGRELPKLEAAATQIGIQRAEELNRRGADGRIDPFGCSTVIRWLGPTRELFSRFNREKS